MSIISSLGFDRLDPSTSQKLFSSTDGKFWDPKANYNKEKRIEEMVAISRILRDNSEITRLDFSFQPVDLRVAVSLQGLVEVTKYSHLLFVKLM
jgi:hypothetical protein